MLVAGLLVDQHGMLGCWRTSMGCRFAGLTWDAGLLMDQHGMLCERMSLCEYKGTIQNRAWAKNLFVCL